jgi:hypothetical protein
MKLLIVATLLLASGVIDHQQPQPRKVAKQRGSMARPDLVVQSVALINAEQGEFVVAVRNRGKGQAANCYLRLTILDSEGKQILKITDVRQPPLKANESANLNIRAQISLSSLRYILATDAMNQILETNDRNNSFNGDIEKY